ERWQTGVHHVRNMSQSVPELGHVFARCLLYTGSTMTTAVKAIYENGIVKPKEPRQLQERTEVKVRISTQSPADADPTGWTAVRALIGFVDHAPADMAERHDH